MSTAIHAAVTGTILSIDAAVGDVLVAGATVVLIESMKMEIPVPALQAGRIAQILVAPGDLVQEGQTLATLVAD